MNTTLLKRIIVAYIVIGILSAVLIVIVTNYFDIGYIIDNDGSLTLYLLSIFIVIYAISLIVLLLIRHIYFKPLKTLELHSKEIVKGDFSVLENYDAKTVSSSVENLSAAIAAMGNKLKEKEVEQQHFITNISHDFRTPLTSIKGYVSAMVDGTIPQSEHDKYLNLVLYETNILNNLAEKLLYFNKISRFNSKPEIKTFNINYKIKSVIDTFSHRSSVKKHDYITDFCEEETWVEADESQIFEVLFALAENAIDFSDADTPISFITRKKDGKVYVTVKDEGSGISKDDADKVFDKFYKSDKSRGVDRHGIGLGLSIVKEILIAHGEDISLESELGKGSSFTFTLKCN